MKQNDIISIIQDNDISEYYSLKNLGIEGYAFPYQEALKIVQICKLLAIPILGGDVYSMNNSTIENSGDNWYYNRTPDESYYDYVQNSCNKSESYIRTYKNHFCDRPLFSFVLKNENLHKIFKYEIYIYYFNSSFYYAVLHGIFASA